MRQKAQAADRVAALKELACETLRSDAFRSVMAREKALDMLGYVWEMERRRVA